MNYGDLIKKLKGVPLSGGDVIQALEGETKIIKYSDMWKYKTIDELLHPYDNVVVLYQTKPSYGHWVCVIKHPNNTLEYFDPYGFTIDNPIKYIPEDFRKQSRQDFPQLIRLFLDSPYNIEINHKKIQKFEKDTSSCGRHCVMRIILKDVPLQEYQKIFKKDKFGNGDDKIVSLTSFI